VPEGWPCSISWPTGRSDQSLVGPEVGWSSVCRNVAGSFALLKVLLVPSF